MHFKINRHNKTGDLTRYLKKKKIFYDYLEALWPKWRDSREAFIRRSRLFNQDIPPQDLTL